MSMDLHSRGAMLKRLLASDTQDMVATVLNKITAAIGVQSNGSVASDQHRLLNFLGAGVTVSDDPANRRSNIYIPGAQANGNGTTINSDTTAKALSLWNGSSNNAPPTNWQLASFSDSGWSNAVVASVGSGVGNPQPISGTSALWSSTPPLDHTEECLIRRTFTLPSGQLVGATFSTTEDANILALYINGNAVSVSDPTNSNTPQTISIPTSYLLAGQSNLIAVEVQNFHLGAGTDWAWLSFRLSVSGGNPGYPYINVQDQKVSGSAGGTFTSGSWQTRTLNTLVADTAGIASLASNQITLPAGTYWCLIRATAGGTNQNQARLQNVTDSVTLLLGNNTYGSVGGSETLSTIGGEFTLSASKALSVQHRANTTGNFGTATSWGTEVYAVAEFWKYA